MQRPFDFLMKKTMPDYLPPASEWRLCFERFSVGCLLRSLPVYDALFNHSRGWYPYLPRLNKPAFASALHNPNVAKVVAKVGGHTFALPFFAPVEDDGSLSTPYYAQIERERSIRILHFFTLPGFIQGPQNCPPDALEYLSSLSGAHAFSYLVTEADDACDSPVRKLATAAGLAPGVPEQLSAQKFFSGKFRLLQAQGCRPTCSLLDAYKERETELGISSGARLKLVLDEAEIECLWEIYEQGLANLATEHPVHQSMYPETFWAVAENPTVIKGIAYNDSGYPCAMMLFAPAEALPAKIDTLFFEKRFPVESKQDQVFYILSLVGFGDLKSASYVRYILRLCATLVEQANSDIVIVFNVRDCRQQALLYLFKKYLEGTGKVRISFHEVGSLRCKLIQLGKRENL